jgi:hypothetical protein
MQYSRLAMRFNMATITSRQTSHSVGLRHFRLVPEKFELHTFVAGTALEATKPFLL